MRRTRIQKDGRGFWTYAGRGVGVGSSFLLLNAQQYVYIKIGLQAAQRSQRRRRLVRSSVNNFGQAMSTFPSGGSCVHCTPFSMCLMMTFRQCQFLSTRSLDSIAPAAHSQGFRHHPSRLHLQREQARFRLLTRVSRMSLCSEIHLRHTAYLVQRQRLIISPWNLRINLSKTHPYTPR